MDMYDHDSQILDAVPCKGDAVKLLSWKMETQIIISFNDRTLIG
jgi:hypothetical protein